MSESRPRMTSEMLLRAMNHQVVDKPKLDKLKELFKREQIEDLELSEQDLKAIAPSIIPLKE